MTIRLHALIQIEAAFEATLMGMMVTSGVIPGR
jgi:hypothetical protein